MTLRPRQNRGIKTSRRGRGSTEAAPRLPRGEVSASRHTSLIYIYIYIHTHTTKEYLGCRPIFCLIRHSEILIGYKGIQFAVSKSIVRAIVSYDVDELTIGRRSEWMTLASRDGFYWYPKSHPIGPTHCTQCTLLVPLTNSRPTRNE